MARYVERADHAVADPLECRRRFMQAQDQAIQARQ
jgi:hypothetical protein